MITRIAAVRIFTAQLDRARQFYGDVLGLGGRRDGPGYSVFTLADADIVVEAVGGDDAEARDPDGNVFTLVG